MAFKYIPYLFSQYVWIMILAVFACIPFMLPHKNSVKGISSLQSSEYFTKKPIVFTHITDIHIDTGKNETIHAYEKVISLIKYTIKPDFNVITGDLANNFPGKDLPHYGRQMKNDYPKYNELTQKLRDCFPVYEVDGNHDLFGVYDESSYLDKRGYKNPYFVKNYTYENLDYAFIGLNPYKFPSPHPPLMYYARLTDEFKAELESQIDYAKQTNKRIVIFDHYPYYDWQFSDGEWFKRLIKEKGISLFLNGHLHPKEPITMHHDGFLEIVGSDLYQHKKFAVGVIDNDRLSYHVIGIEKVAEKYGFVTNPVRDCFLSSHVVFNQKEIPVRMVVYNASTHAKISASISGIDNDFPETTKELSCDENLCQTENFTLDYGRYHLRITGEFSDEFDFTIGDTLPDFKEDVYEPSTSFVIQYQVQLGLIWFFLLVILEPFIKVPERLSANFNMWIEGQSSESMWLYSIFLGFLAVKSRIERLPNLIRYSLFVAVLWPSCLPLIFITIDGKFGFVWTWGFVCKGAHFDLWGQMFALMYFAAFLLPIVTLFSAMAISLPFKCIFIVDFIPPLACMYFEIYILLRWCNQSAGHLGAAFSLFSFTIIYFYTLMIVWRCRWRKGLKEAILIPSAALLDNESRE